MKTKVHEPIRIRDAVSKVFTFNDLSQLLQFVEQEEEFWRTQGQRFDAEGKPGRHRYFESYEELEGIKPSIVSLQNQWPELNEQQIERGVHDIQQHWDSVLRRSWLWSNHLYIPAFIECNLKYGEEAATAFINYARGAEPSLGSRLGFLGTMLAYECLHPDRDRESRRDGERKSLERLRDRLHAETEELQQWGTDTRDKVQKWLETARSEAEELQSTNKGKGEKQVMDQGAIFDKQMKSWKQEKRDLDDLYAEILRWREPAKHWKNAAEEHKCQGLIAISVLFLMIVAGLSLLGFLIYSWLQGQKIGVDLDTLHGVVFFGSIMAVYGFFIRVLSRLTFSSFHLMRDAKEREQLTYLYLSLSETDPSERKSRDIVLRSLFSRSQTGLLANESGPSIPAEVIQAKSP